MKALNYKLLDIIPVEIAMDLIQKQGPPIVKLGNSKTEKELSNHPAVCVTKNPNQNIVSHGRSQNCNIP